MNDIVVREGTEDDLPAALELIRELAVYEKAPDEVICTVESMREDGFGPHPVFGFYVAEENERVLGLALHYTKYSTWKGKCLFLEDIIVKESERRRGIGKLLFDRIVELAEERGVKRLEWQVLDWNTPAIEFYKKYDTIFEPEWLNGKLIWD
jgi:GNAT superfamily N-acetyltransferase